MFNNRSIVFKIAALFLICSTCIIALAFGYNYWTSRKTIIEMSLEHGWDLGRETSGSIAARLKPVEMVVQNVAKTLEEDSVPGERIPMILRRLMAEYETVFGMAVAFEPYAMDSAKNFYAPYGYRTEEGISFKMLGSKTYRYFLMDWYQLPKELGKPYWTEPYFDEQGGEVLMVTYSVPFYRVKDEVLTFTGVVTADISLDWLHEQLSSLKLYENGYPVLYSQNGTVIYHPDTTLVANETIFSYAEQFNDERLWSIGRRMIEGQSGIVEYSSNYSTREIFFLFMPLSFGNWSVGLLLPKEEMLSSLTEVTRNTVIISLLGFLILALAIINITRRVAKPIIALSSATREIAKGNLDAEIPEYTDRDEIGQLTEAFCQMEISLKTYIDELTSTTISKERIESELRIASEIQMGILPKLFPAFPERPEFDVYATIAPAKEVGGDLYDFFFIDDDHFCFLIGDVSGKGVPAAFFMAVTKTMLNIVSEQKKDPGKILIKVNDDLAKDNEACMFVTLFLGVIDIRSGMVRYASAGHNPPVLLKKNEEPVWLPVPREPVAGAMEGMPYTTHEVSMAHGDTLFLYTDGVTEAMNEAEEFYGDQKLLDLLKEKRVTTSQELVQVVETSVAEFAGEAEQADDITMLALQYTN